MQENAFETNPVSVTTTSTWSSANIYLHQLLGLFLKWLLFSCLFLYFSCDNIDSLDIAPSDATEIDTTLIFFTVSTTNAIRKEILHTVELTGEIDEGDCLCLQEVGFFYSFEAEALFNQDLTYQDLLDNTSNVTRIEVPQQNITRISDNPKGKFSYTFDLPTVDTTYFFRSYAIFHDSKTQRLERTHLSEETTPIQVTLKNGWYKKSFERDLWARQGAISVVDPDDHDAIIVGLGCAFPSHCGTNIEEHPFLKLEFKDNDEVDITEQKNCPRDRSDISGRTDTVYNRRYPIAFTIGDLVYFGTGLLNGSGTKDFFAYNPKRCEENSEKATQLELPAAFRARIEAIGFSINDFGYIGLGKEGKEPLDDFWRFNPIDNEWCPIEISILGDTPFYKRSRAITVITNDNHIIFGGGLGAFSSPVSDFWKFTPDPINCTATIEPISKPPSLGIDADGISFTINDIPYAGLGNLNNQLYKFQNENKNEPWKEVAPFPGTSISGGIGFSSKDRGYLFTGTKNDGTLTNLSNDLWVYVPE